MTPRHTQQRIKMKQKYELKYPQYTKTVNNIKTNKNSLVKATVG